MLRLLVLFLLASVSLLQPTPSSARNSTDISRVTALHVVDRSRVGRFDGVRYVRIYGTVEGIVTPTDNVVNFDSLPLNADGNFVYTSEFELITPRRQRKGTRTVFVEAENRGNPELFGWINGFTAVGTPETVEYPPGFGNGFLFREGHSYARVQWQTGIAAGVPDDVEGVGLVIQRDFASLLERKRRHRKTGARLPRFRTLILMGDSQSGWEVSTFVGEGFNRSPRTGRPVFDGVISINGHGNWLAINELNGPDRDQFPYVRQFGVPLTPQELLSRPESDPVLVNVGAFTDYFRIRASLFQERLPHAGIHHYDWPYPHASLFMVPNGEFPFVEKGCNGGVVEPLNPVDMRPFLRKIVSGLANELNAGRRGVDREEGLPRSAFFELGLPPADPPPICLAEVVSDERCTFNPLPGAILATPRVDEDRQPLGGVRFPDVVLPLGRPDPRPLNHVGTVNITDLCGNFWAWEPFDAQELIARYGSAEAYEDAYEEVVEGLVDEGYLLEDDADVMLEEATAHFESLIGAGSAE